MNAYTYVFLFFILTQDMKAGGIVDELITQLMHLEHLYIVFVDTTFILDVI